MSNFIKPHNINERNHKFYRRGLLTKLEPIILGIDLMLTEQ